MGQGRVPYISPSAAPATPGPAMVLFAMIGIPFGWMLLVSILRGPVVGAVIGGLFTTLSSVGFVQAALDFRGRRPQAMVAAGAATAGLKTAQAAASGDLQQPP